MHWQRRYVLSPKRFNSKNPTNVRDRCGHPDQVIATKSSRHLQETLPNLVHCWTKTCPIAEDYLSIMTLHKRSLVSRAQCMESYGSKCAKEITWKLACFSLCAHPLVFVTVWLLMIHCFFPCSEKQTSVWLLAIAFMVLYKEYCRQGHMQ